MSNPSAGGGTITLGQHLGGHRRVTSKGYPTLGICTTSQYYFYYATCPYTCIHESLLILYQLGNYYGRYNELVDYCEVNTSEYVAMIIDEAKREKQGNANLRESWWPKVRTGLLKNFKSHNIE